MELAFQGEKEDGSPEVFKSWRQLAKANPWALIDPTTLSEEKRLWLLQQLLKYQKPVRVRDGDEQIEMIPTSLLLKDKLRRFARANIPRLIKYPNFADMAKQEAHAFLTQKFGEFSDISKVFIVIGKQNVELNMSPPLLKIYLQGGGNLYDWVRGDSLLGAFRSGELKSPSKVWHAVRIIVSSIKCQEAVTSGEISAAINLAVEIGESRKALSIQLTKASDTSRGGKARATSNSSRHEDRDEYIKKEFSEMRSALSVSERCGLIEKRLANHQNCLGTPPKWKPIKKRQIITIVTTK